MLFPVLVIADVVEKILLPVLATDKDVPPKTLLPVPVFADVPPTLLPVPEVADVPPKIPLPVFVAVEKALLKKPLPEFVMVEGVPLKLLFPELVTTSVVQPEALLIVLPVSPDLSPKILLPELVKAAVLPKGSTATLPEFVPWVLASVTSTEVADDVEPEVDAPPEDANLKRGAAVKEGTEASIEGLLVVLAVT